MRANMKNLIKDCRGFTLLELIIVITIFGIISSIAIPRFNNSLALANTVKIKADLEVINTAIALYEVSHHRRPQNIKIDLDEFIADVDKMSPPQGDCLMRDGSKQKITAKEYTLDAKGERALCQNHPLADFGPSAKVS